MCRCTTCFECPCCGIALYSRGVTQQVPSEDDPNVIVNKRGYYLMCNSCKYVYLSFSYLYSNEQSS